MTDTVLVANRGEIAVRVIRTLRATGRRAVAVHTEEDAEAPHVGAADEAVALTSGDGGPATYLDVDAVLAAARRSGAGAVHPGYGFLAENAGFASECRRAGLVFVGPSPDAIDTMGDKIRAKAAVAAAGVPVLPGVAEDPAAPLTDQEWRAAVGRVGLPILLKPSAGGGGKGMRLVRDLTELPSAVRSARREAVAAFGDGTLLAERYVENPRHVEIQVIGDSAGCLVHLGERECSLQRRHQKIVEEAPSPVLSDVTRAAMGEAAVRVARAVDYVGAGTVEFIVGGDRPDEFFFLEMNTRLQVEHPVTELVTTVEGRRGVDLVALQLGVADGAGLPGLLGVATDGRGPEAEEAVRAALGTSGHAVEARVYAEDPARGFLPTGGRVRVLREPGGEHVRVDSGIATGVDVGTGYDPMLAKVVAWAPNRREALSRLDRALGEHTVLGVRTNVPFLRALLRDADVVAGRLSTGLVERFVEGERLPTTDPPGEVLVAGALWCQLDREPAGPVASRFALPDGWRWGGPAATPWWLGEPGRPAHRVLVTGGAEDAAVSVGGADPVRGGARLDGTELTVRVDGRTRVYTVAREGGRRWLAWAGGTWELVEREPLAAVSSPAATTADGQVRSPMPGTVLTVGVAVGDQVVAGQELLVVEAMKMEHTVTAPVAGSVAALLVRPGSRVALDEDLAVVDPTSATAPSGDPGPV
ncbi:ATP-grasp domain-containing protein [Actinoalloteichus sp. AHMU CJ021]|uniref:ATP-binding protein n=1 Tax=Actinoalloteichus TaxID=65496 RepID=UPI00047A120A|nr:biotin carboxylase N-terminal domain-containing protein [Actinoalloteichus caeruleus]AUS79672.1 ATP-grasp domain-containing protein [Actinoalloteichus sp. AHMU CJ021]